MKTKCPISGIVTIQSFLPAVGGELPYFQFIHPIFSYSIQQLIPHVPPILEGKFKGKEEQVYLIFLSLLNHTGLIEFSSPALFKRSTSYKVALSCLEPLMDFISKKDLVKNQRAVFASLKITQENRDLKDIGEIIDCWNLSLQDFLGGMKEEEKRERLQEIEETLQRQLNSVQVKSKIWAPKLAEWAAITADFPETQKIETIYGLETIKSYWKKIIISASLGRAGKIPKADIEELKDHLLENLINYGKTGSTYATRLFEVLESSNSVKTTFEILGKTTEKEEEILQRIKETATTQEPKPYEFKSTMEYIKALAAWNLRGKK